MSNFSNRRKLLPTQVDFSRLVSGTPVGATSFVALDANGKLVLGSLNDYITGDITSVVAGNGLTGGGTSGDVTLTVGQGTGITVAADAISTNDSEIVHDNLSGFVANEHIDHTSVSITAGTGLSGGGTIASTRTLSTNDSEIVHDNLSGFVANEHIDHSSVSITAGNGLTGGGTIASTRTLAVGEGTGISVAADSISTNDSEIVHDNLSGFVANEHINHTSVSITAGNGLTGGGTIASTRTLTVGEGTGITVGSTTVSTNDSEIVHDNLSGFVANEHINHSSVSITAGNGLTGGGTIAASRTIAVGAGTGVTVNANDIAIGQAVGTSDNVTFSTVTVASDIIHSGDTNNKITFGTDTQTFTTAGSPRIVIASDGKVGIGRTPTTYPLEVAGDIYATDDIVVTDDIFVGDKIVHLGDSNNHIAFGTDTQTFTTANATALSIDASGHVSKPLQPCFRATKSAAQENFAINETVIVTFDGETFDIGSNFASSAFTAPIAGIYLFGTHLDFDALDISAAYILLRLVQEDTGATITRYNLDQKDPNEYNTDMEFFGLNGSILISCATGDTIKLGVYQSGGAAISDIGINTRFWGTLIN